MSFHRFISYFLHPIIFPLIGTTIYLYALPRFLTSKYKLTVFLIVFIGSYLIPLVLLYMLKKMKMITSFHLETVEERKFPLLIITFLAILIGKLFLKVSIIDELAFYFFAGGLGMLVVYGFLWFNRKVSIHMFGISGLIGFLIVYSLKFNQNLLFILGLLFVFLGLVGNARLKMKAHTNMDLFWGILIGASTQIIIPFLYQFIN